MGLNIVSWNCQNGLKGKDKGSYIEKLNADILVLQEVKESDLGCPYLSKSHQSFWMTNNKTSKNPKGLGVYVFNKKVFAKLLPRNEDFELFLPVRFTGEGCEFDIVCVWDFNHRAKGLFMGKSGVIHQAIDFYKSNLFNKSIWVGDYNNGPEIKNGKLWSEIVNKMISEGYQKANISNTEIRHTYAHNLGRSFEIDHCFVRGFKTFNCILASGEGFTKSPSDHIPIILKVS